MTGSDQILTALWKRRATALVTFALTLAAIAVVTFALPKVYSSSTLLWVNPANVAGSDFEATQTSQVLTKSYAELLQGRTVAIEVARELPFERSASELQDAVEVAPVSQSQLLRITAEQDSPAHAQQVAATYARVFVERSRELAGIGATSSKVTLAEPAALPGSPSRPRPALYLLIGTLLAGFAGVGVALLRQRLDQRIEVDEETTELLGLPVLGRIPDLATGRRRVATEAGIAEAFRLLIANLAFAGGGRRPPTIAVVSPNEGEGKSTCCVEAGRAAAELGLRVLLVDGDLRRPSLASKLEVHGLRHARGFSAFLAGTSSLAEAVAVAADRLDLIPAGPTPPSPPALLGSDALAEFDRQARAAYELVVYDTPPLAVGADASLLAAQSEGVILVVDVKRTRRSAAVQAVHQLQRAGTRVLGVVLNRAGVPAGHYDYYRSEGNGGRRSGAGEAVSTRRG